MTPAQNGTATPSPPAAQNGPATASKEAEYPPWAQPDGKNRSGLVVNNSLTGTKVPFVLPNNSNQITWYICGPTVYDSAHVGHASNYVRFDIVRRILSRYFGFDVIVQMNITDVDDKIIKKANERQEPFEKISQFYEREFLEDMQALNILPADYVTRVSEYMPEIIEYIQTIVKNGFAYESGGSVYFDTSSFKKGGHDYGKCAPWCVDNASLLAEGEGVLTAADETTTHQKKNASDFALWKKSKPGEPVWDSEWGAGRPGWHIECSAMASNVLGPVVDIHAGGVDLRFPHHSNEIAQAEAYHNCSQWVNYFLHAGHLHIDGLKMSKSLKNFITIRECLKRYNARQMRLLFLGHKYDAPMEYAEHSMGEAVSLDRTLTDFFGSLKGRLRDLRRRDETKAPTRPGPPARSLADALRGHQEKVHSALADNFDTPTAMLELQTLIKETNAYMAETGARGNVTVLESVGRYLSRMFGVFGLIPDMGELSYGKAADGGQSREAAVAPLLDVFAGFRDQVREIARGEKNWNGARELLEMCDQLRDDVLPRLGVRLEDRTGENSVWKLEDAESLMLEIRRKKEEEEKRRAEKEALKEAKKQKELAALMSGKLAPAVMFKEGEEFKGMYSAFDDDGVPTTDKDGEALAKSARKALVKRLGKQKKLHEKYLAAVADGRIASA